jgi:DNA-binding GntR family transcriptional regulator
MHEQILQSRRGVGGGLYTRFPTTQAVAHFASIYLTSVQARMDEVIKALASMRAEAVRLVTINPDIEVRKSPMIFLDQHEGFEELRDYRLYSRVANGFHKLMARLCGNPALGLFLEILRAYTSETRWGAEFSIMEGDLHVYFGVLKAQAAAIAQGNVSKALVLSHQQAELVAGFLLPVD